MVKARIEILLNHLESVVWAILISLSAAKLGIGMYIMEIHCNGKKEKPETVS